MHDPPPSPLNTPPGRLEEALRVPASPPGRILQAAEDLFAARGFDGTTTRDIAQNAQVNIATIHYYWRSKEELWHAVIFRMVQEIASLARDLNEPPAGDPADEIRNFVSRVVDIFADNPNYARLLQYRTLKGVSPEAARDIALPILDMGLQFLEKRPMAGFAGVFDPSLVLFSFQGALRIFFQETDSVKVIFGEDPKAFSPGFKKRLKDLLSALALHLAGLNPGP